MSRDRELVDLEMHRHFNTEKAVLVSLDGDRDKAVWLPFSQIEVMLKHGSIVEITLPVDLAEDKGLV